MNDELLKDETLYIKPIEAFRKWHVVLTDNGPRLAGILSSGRIWPPRQPFEAHCLVAGGSADKYHAADPTVPARYCTCGVCGEKSEREEEVNNFRKLSRGALCGKVALWGKIIEDEDGEGWASRFAYPLSINGFFCIRCEKTHGLKTLTVSRLLPQYKTTVIRGGFVFSCSPDFTTRIPSRPSPLAPSEILCALAGQYELTLEYETRARRT